jgi:serine/threonine protein kinase/tetratricopeptide (TPR) repeat protein
MPLTPGARLGRFEIVARLGAGGMGEVYRALDPQLEREIALKVLPAAMLADATARSRLLREARMAARLNHPNVCTVHEVGEAEGQVYVAMELVSGRTLSERLSTGRIVVEEAALLGQQMADALAHAHEKGVVHRDFKSPNVIITPEGRAKVLDFGLAKPLVETESEATTETATPLTAAGVVVGTLAYMAPEQLRGKPADARSDIWALGVVLYEMAGGERPFGGKTGYELSSAILNQTPNPLPAEVPPPLAAVIERCLAKEPGQRYQRAGEVRSALETLRAGSVPTTWPGRRPTLLTPRRRVLIASLLTFVAIAAALGVFGLRGRLLGPLGGPGPAIRMAVLPFANLTGDPEQEYLSDGFTQELISQLGRLHPARMSVIGRTSVMRYKKSETPLEQIGRELGVGYILGGSCRRESTRVRISVELIQARDQSQLWTETYERELSGMLALQSDVARKVAGALALRLLPGDEARLVKVRSIDPEAYEAYLKGVKHREAMSKAGFDEAERCFNLALEKDPGYAAPWAGLAGVWNSRLQLNMAPREEGLIKAKSAALKALALDDGEIEARRVLAGILTWTDWDWAAAERAWGRLFEIDPDNPTALPGYSHSLLVMGRLDEAIVKSERALELDPYNIRSQSFHATVLMHVRRFDEAIAVARKVLRVQPNSEVARTALIDSLFKKGMLDELMTLERETWAKDPELTNALEQGYAANGFSGAERSLADALAARYGRPGSRTAYTMANYYARAGDKDCVIEWLEKAYLEHNNNLPYMRTPVFDLVRSDPRFQDLVRRVGLPER